MTKRFEAYGVKGMQSKQWRKEFNSYQQAEKWAETNNAEIQGFREVESDQDWFATTGRTKIEKKHSWADGKCQSCGTRWSVMGADVICGGAQALAEKQNKHETDCTAVVDDRECSDRGVPLVLMCSGCKLYWTNAAALVGKTPDQWIAENKGGAQ